MSRAERLRAYVDALGPIVWGESDCCAFAAKWASLERAISIARPSYRSKIGAHRLIAKAGGLDRLVSSLLPMLPRTVAPQLGDIGIVHLSEGDVGTIFAGNGIACIRSEAGVFFLRPSTIVSAWEV